MAPVKFPPGDCGGEHPDAVTQSAAVAIVINRHFAPPPLTETLKTIAFAGLGNQWK